MGDVWAGNLSATNFQDRAATMKDFLLLVLVGILTSGCVEKMFQPPPPAFLSWTAPGRSIVDVKKTLLECGMPEPASKGSEYYHLTRNEQASISLCMEKAAFQHKDGRLPWCANYREMNLPVCAPGATVPTPSISRRLNSPYCRAKTDYKYCKQNARHPDGCDRNDYKNPVPECLP